MSGESTLSLLWNNIVRRRARQRGAADRSRVLIIGDAAGTAEALSGLARWNVGPVDVVGYLSEGAGPAGNGHVSRLGGLEEMQGVVDRWGVDHLVLALPQRDYLRVEEALAGVVGDKRSAWLLPEYLHRGAGNEPGGEWRCASPLTTRQRLVKRAFDLVTGTVLLAPALMALAVVALAIKLDSPGPVFFKQLRVGEGGRLFWMYKFRSMVAGADQRFEDVARLDANGNLAHKSAHDPRVTRLGRFLRRTSLDELPQIFNVLKGEMTLVGPRPELPLLVQEYAPWQWERLSVPQGITGWWQVSGRSDRPMHLHTEDDLYYVRHYSLLLDLRILLKTIPAVIQGRGAY